MIYLLNQHAEGYIGSHSLCASSNHTLRDISFHNTRVLNSSEGMTIVVGFKKGIIPILVVAKPKTLLEKFLTWPSEVTFVISILFGVFTVFYIWFQYGRDYWSGKNLFGGKGETGIPKPIGGHETVVVEFTPPEKLTPAEIGVLMDERADTLHVVGTIIDLATHGYLKITEVEKKWMFGKTDYILTKQNKEKKDKKALMLYEEKLLDKLFTKREMVTISELKTTFYEELSEIKKELYNQVVSKMLFPSNPEKVRNKYLAIAFLFLFAGVGIVIFSVNADFILAADIGFGITLSAVLLIIFSRFMPRRTAYGRELYRRTKGYRLFIEKAEKYRQQYFERENLFNEVLPYAIVFGLTEKFAKAMQEMGIKNTDNGWYVGAHTFNTVVFASHINDFSRSMTSSIAATPSSSGFSGGGSVGGGFGGGGGGSW